MSSREALAESARSVTQSARQRIASTRRLYLSGAIFLLALIVRLVPWGLYVTPDEPIWVQRSIMFMDALHTGNWQAIPQTGHPGITTMALGALGTWIMTRLAPTTAAAHLAWIRPILWLAPENEAAFHHLAFFLPAGRVLVAMTASLGLALAYRVGRQRLGARPARLVVLLLALDPFFSGYAGLLHTDALQATFALLAVLLALPAASPPAGGTFPSGSGRVWLSWIGSGLFLALAGLTKTLGLLVAPGLALALVLWGEGDVRRRVVKVGVIAVSTLVCLFAFYPPFWVSPAAAVRLLLDAVTYHEGIGLRPVFFFGASQVDPGAAFYPVVLLFRLTPPVLIGLLLGIRPARRAKTHLRRGLMVLMPTLVYLVAITVASKKFDRYVLTVVPLLTVAAVSGWRRLRWARWAILVGLVLPWAWTALIPLQYASPALGGPWVARRVVPLGWSEGSGFAAHRLNRQFSEPATARIMSHNVPGTASVFEGTVWPWDAAQQGCVDAVLGTDGIDTDRFTVGEPLYVSGLLQAVVAYRVPSALPESKLLVAGPLPGVAPASTAPVTGTTQLAAWLSAYLDATDAFIWVHAPACYALTESQLGALLGGASDAGTLSCTPSEPVLGFSAERCVVTSAEIPETGFVARFGGRADLVAASRETLVQAPNPLAVRLRWQPQANLGNLVLYLALVTETAGEQIVWAEGGRQLVDAAGRPASAWQPGHLVDSDGYIPLPLELPPGTYELVMRVSEAGGWMGLTYPDDSFGGIGISLGQVRVEPPPFPAPPLDLPAIPDPGWPGVRLVGAHSPVGDLWAGRPLRFSLGIERTAGPTPAALAWELVCAGAPRDGGTLSWPVDTPSEWRGGHRYLLNFAPRLDAATPEGVCQVWLAPTEDLAGPRTAAHAGLFEDEHAVLIGEIRVLQRERIFELPDEPDFQTGVAIDGFASLRGADLSTTALAPGEPVTLTLYWEAVDTAPKDYTVFAHLIGPDGRAWGQSDAVPAGGKAPTVTWLPGEVVTDVHSMTLPAEAPTGEYRLYVGLYDPQTGARVPLFAGEQRLPEERAQVAELEVAR